MTRRKGFVLASLFLILFLVPLRVPAPVELRGALDAAVRATNVAARALGDTRGGAALVREATPYVRAALRALAPLAASPWTLPGASAVFVAAMVALLVKRQSIGARVLRLARRGRPVAAIARSTGLSQDEVRARLQPRRRPATSVRKALPGGKRGRWFRRPAAAAVPA